MLAAAWFQIAALSGCVLMLVACMGPMVSQRIRQRPPKAETPPASPSLQEVEIAALRRELERLRSQRVKTETHSQD